MPVTKAGLSLKTGVISNAVNMPSVDARTLEQIRPYITLGGRLASFVQQLAHHSVEELKVTYYGKIIALDAVPITRAIQRGFLSLISNSVNDVNAPAKFKEMGVAITVTKSSDECDYNELIAIEAYGENRLLASVSGTLLGKGEAPRIVQIDGRDREVNPANTLLCMQNEDVPGIVGFLGTVMGEEGVNIANMSLAREGEGTAVSVFELDSAPTEAALERIKSHAAVRKVRTVHL